MYDVVCEEGGGGDLPKLDLFCKIARVKLKGDCAKTKSELLT